MDLEDIRKATERFLQWEGCLKKTSRLERHEAMKAILFSLSPYCKLEHNTVLGRFDFYEHEWAIEIDDAVNRRALEKLKWINGDPSRDHSKRKALWVVIISHGTGARVIRAAQEYGIPLLLIRLTKGRRIETFM